MAGFSNQPLNLQKAIRQQALIHKQFAEQWRQFNEESSKRLAEQWRQFNEESSKRLAEQRRQFAEQFRRLNEESSKRLAEQWRQFNEESSERFAELFRRLTEEIPERDRKALQRLGEEGWFFDPEMPPSLLQKIERLFDEHPDEIAERLSDFFRTRLDVIEEALIDLYPHRGHLFQQAFQAHREGKYGLSIPVFLTQADGVFWDQTSEKQNLFMSSRQRERAYNEYVSQISNSHIVIYLHPLSILLPLWMNRNERAERGDPCVGLNRHQVLHGESVDYGTEQNSLKAISLLSYLHWILSEIDKRASDN